MKILKLFNIFLISITIVTSGCSGLEYGKSVNSIEIKYDTIEKYEDRGSTMGPTIMGFSRGVYSGYGIVLYYIVLPMAIVLLIGTTTIVIIYNY